MDALVERPRHAHGPPVARDSVDSESLDLLDGYADAYASSSYGDYGDYSETPNDSSSPVKHQQTQTQQQQHWPPRRQSSLHHHRNYHHHNHSQEQQPPPVSHAYSQSESRAVPTRQPSPGHARSQTLDAVTTTANTNATIAIAADPAALPAPLYAIKRKPLSSSASPLAIRFSQGSSHVGHHSPTSSVYSSRDLPKPETRFSRTCSVDSPTLYQHLGPGLRDLRELDSDIDEEPFALLPAPLQTQPPPPPRDPLDDASARIPLRNTTGTTPAPPKTSTLADLTQTDLLLPNADVILARPSLQARRATSAGDHGSDDASESAYSRGSDGSSTMSIVAPKPTPPHLSLERVENSSDNSTPATTILEYGTRTPEINKPLPKSPGSTKFGQFFGWAISPSPSTTEFSSLPSPLASKPGSTDDTTGTSFLSRKGSKANASFTNPLGYLETNLLTPPPAPTPSPPAQIQEMEDELKAIGAELAASIRREMDLEDLVDRLQSEITNPQAPGKRTSDYFSDSGVSSAKYSDYDQNKEEVEKIQRRAEQDKASLRLELTNKVQEEREKRRDLDQQIRELSERASQIDLAQMNSVDASGRVRELEKTCEDLRRRLSEEKMVKNNFEDLLSAIRSELEDASNERDNLRDEVVPQLKARVEGLEAEASEYANLTYESSKMQQELQNLKTENLNLRTIKQPSEDPPSRSSPALSRSNSVTAGFKLQRAPNGLNGPPSGLSRSNTVKGAVESREALAERLKDVEAQRDALHNALRNLLERQEFQNRENEKKIKILELERERLMTMSPGKAAFDKDIGSLRNEIKVLRRRAEEAIEHKWQAEKGLAGLKMDLDRAEEEIASLRALLKEKDILIPPSMARASSDSSKDTTPVTSEGLVSSFKDLQAAYQDALDKIKTLQASGAAQYSDEMTQLAMQRLEQSLASAVFERDAAIKEAAALKTQVDSLNESEAQHADAERALANELQESARRIEELATQVRQQLATNASLRQRLSDTVGRGDADRKTNVERIATLQSRLRTLEDQVVAAQAASEERVARHDEQMKELRDATSLQLRRSPASPRSKGSLSPSKGLSPLPSPMFPRSPRSPRRLPKMTIEDEVQVDKLRARVSELEQALGEAESEMQSVIVRMSEAQIEVLTLQEEREAAVRETRKLQRELEGEKVKAFEDRFRALSNA